MRLLAIVLLTSSPGASSRLSSCRYSSSSLSLDTLRYIWATWGFQIGLTDRQLEALAYAMGHTVETLRAMYERCTPDEKRRPIEERIDELLFAESPGSNETDKVTLSALIQLARHLSLPEQQQLIEALTA